MALKEVLNANLMHFVEFYIASPDKDMKEATDIVIRVKGGDVALRIREADCKYRDFTVRAKNRAGRTEIDKLREGFGRWYLYAWSNGEGGFSDWIIVDLDKLREGRLLDEDYPIKMNQPFDGTGFIAIPQNDLKTHQCIIAYKNHAKEVTGEQLAKDFDDYQAKGKLSSA